ncbi:MAG: hypothetical protein LIP08_02050 [Bacteroides sp.]|nr:hypothetical protein [Bacteroides sp.]
MRPAVLCMTLLLARWLTGPTLVRAQSVETDREVFLTALHYLYGEIIENPIASCITICHRYEGITSLEAWNEFNQLDPALVDSF